MPLGTVPGTVRRGTVRRGKTTGGTTAEEMLGEGALTEGAATGRADQAVDGSGPGRVAGAEDPARVRHGPGLL